MSGQGYREIRQTGLFGRVVRVLFFVFNAVMLIWLISYWVLLSGLDATTSAERAGAAVGGVIGTTLLLIIWMAGAGILGALTLATRGQKVFVPIDAGKPVQKHWKKGILACVG